MQVVVFAILLAHAMFAEAAVHIAVSAVRLFLQSFPGAQHRGTLSKQKQGTLQYARDARARAGGMIHAVHRNHSLSASNFRDRVVVQFHQNLHVKPHIETLGNLDLHRHINMVKFSLHI